MLFSISVAFSKASIFNFFHILAGPAGLKLETFSATFEQHCEGLVSALFGTFVFSASGSLPTTTTTNTTTTTTKTNCKDNDKGKAYDKDKNKDNCKSKSKDKNRSTTTTTIHG